MTFYDEHGATGVIHGDEALATFWRRLGALVIDALICAVPATAILLAVPARYEYLVLLGVMVVYFTAFEGSPRGQTPGKSFLRIRVISFDTGAPIGFQRAFVRSVGRIISGLPFDLGYLWMLWDPENQTWHDKFARSVVVDLARLTA